MSKYVLIGIASVVCFLVILVTYLQREALEPRVVLDASLIISELMASNDTVLLDEDSESSDWLEISNPSAYTGRTRGMVSNRQR